MSKKKRCTDCSNHINWALPERVTDQNISYARYCLEVAKNTCVCSITNKTKKRNNEQNCRYFQKRSEIDRKADEFQNEEILKLRQMIAEYEQNQIRS